MHGLSGADVGRRRREIQVSTVSFQTARTSCQDAIARVPNQSPRHVSTNAALHIADSGSLKLVAAKNAKAAPNGGYLESVSKKYR
jgi:hypothetical protein